MLHQRGAGVLMHISSLPSPYGIGVFDRHARDFIDRIADMGFTYWQVLPFNPIDGAGSPYCSPSAFAGNYLFIDPQGLQDMGLATAEEVAANIMMARRTRRTLPLPVNADWRCWSRLFCA